ncbi:N-6 DNA methylase [Actinomyces oris]
MAKQTRSIEPQIADLCNRWMRDMGLDYKLEQEPLNNEIDKALAEYESKGGGKGGNRPDAKLLLTDSEQKHWPILIEYKGYRDKLVKYDAQGYIANRDRKGKPDYRNIAAFAVNGAVHYANALLHFTGYTDIIAIGVTGHLDPEVGTLHHEIGVYYVSRSNLGVGQRVSDFSDLSFLSSEHFGAFIEQVKQLSLAPRELEALREKREGEIAASLNKLNNDIYQNEKGIGESDRVYLVAASIIATLGIPDHVVPLDKNELKSSTELGNRDGDIICRKICAFLQRKNLPEEKRQFLINTLSNVLLQERINKPENGVSQLRRIFVKIIDDLGIYYKIGLTTDFTGRLFNEMYSWLGFSQDKLNDVVLTPSYVATLLARLARVNKDSHVWDFATGSAGLLVAAMNEMLADAKRSITSPKDLARKVVDIKAKQLLGIEILSNVYMLAVLNMILMGDGSSNILNRDSLKEFGSGDAQFPADAFILNPPYSASGNGMVFVEKALSMMSSGYAAVIIQGSAGSGKAVEYNRRILAHSTLLASIKMPIDLFLGKSSVQTYIYVFRVGEAHQADDVVRFIDFTEDGYARSNRKKSAVNLRDVDHATERYAELVDVVRYGEKKLHHIRPQDFFEGTIDPRSGTDWNQSAPIDITPRLEDFKKTVSDYLAWEIATLLKNADMEDDRLGK